jgi:hypothetical protein
MESKTANWWMEVGEQLSLQPCPVWRKSGAFVLKAIGIRGDIQNLIRSTPDSQNSSSKSSNANEQPQI